MKRIEKNTTEKKQNKVNRENNHAIGTLNIMLNNAETTKNLKWPIILNLPD